jgi:hypothetical protein
MVNIAKNVLCLIFSILQLTNANFAVKIYNSILTQRHA